MRWQWTASVRVMLLALLVLPAAFSYAADHNTLNMSVQVANATEVSGLNTTLLTTTRTNNQSNVESGAIYANDSTSVQIDSSSKFVNSDGHAVLQDAAQQQILVTLYCKPCGTDSKPTVFSPTQGNLKTLVINAQDATSDACEKSPAYCYYRTATSDDNKTFGGNMTLTVKSPS